MNVQDAADRISRYRITQDSIRCQVGLPPQSMSDFTIEEWHSHLATRLTLAFMAPRLDSELLESFVSEALAAYIAACEADEARVDVGEAAA